MRPFARAPRPLLSTVRAALSLTAAAALGACGTGGAPGDYGPTIATLHGTLQITTPPPDPAEIRIALVWDGNLGTQPERHLMSQDVPVTASWPAQFELKVTEPPPEAAMFEFAPNFTDIDPTRYAQAHVVAYRDLNHNQHLDFTPVDATAFVDELIAYDPHVTVQYQDRNQSVGGTPGYELITQDGEVDISTPITLLTGLSTHPASCHLLEWMPRSAHEAALHSYPDPHEGDQGPWDREREFECPDDAPPVEAERVACDPASTVYGTYEASWSTTTSAWVADTCGPVMRICGRGRDTTQPPPAGWPCPCDPTKYQCVDYWSDL